MELKKGIDICICTFNRAGYLQQCIEPLIPQLSHDNVILTVIDNNSTDDTAAVVKSFTDKNIPIRYFFEPVQGLSQARNRGWMECQHEWIFYLDDECLPGSDLIEIALKCVSEHPNVAAIGGPIYPVYSSTTPAWLPEGFGKFELPYSTFTIVDHKYLRGCLLIHVNVLKQVGGFNTHLGMKGEELAYAEELELQDRLRKEGFKTGYAPELRIGHQIRPEKLNTLWLLLSEYARRRDKMTYAPISFIQSLWGFIRTVGGRGIHLPIYTYMLLTKKNYTKDHFTIDVMKPLMYRTGEIAGVIKNLLGHHIEKKK